MQNNYHTNLHKEMIVHLFNMLTASGTRPDRGKPGSKPGLKAGVSPAISRALARLARG